MLCKDICIKKKNINKIKLSLNASELNEWECCICFETIYSTEMYLCFPYVCNHLTCYDCFIKKIRFENEREREIENYNFTLDRLNCSLCRSIISNRWINLNSVNKYELFVNDHKFYYVESSK